jgi:glutathione synthase/RimK-type ligase-like ATP-grasp enzyme
MILCLGHAADDTFRYSLIRFAQLGSNFDSLDVTQLAIAGSIEGDLDDIPSLTLALNGKQHRLCDYNAIFCRLIDTTSAAPSELLKQRAAAHAQILNQALYMFPHYIINRPGVDNSNATKILHQTLIARRFGVRVPRSILTTERGHAVDFIRECLNGAIIKGASAQKTWVSTVAPNEVLDRLARIGECPSLIQERIIGPDIRVHVVGSLCFAERIVSEGVDYRNHQRCVFTSFPLSAMVSESCIAITRGLGAVFSGIDFKLEESSGELVFLEANTMPCYQGYDKRCKGLISAAIRDLLVVA